MIDSETILNLIAQQPPRGASQRPRLSDVLPGMVLEERERGNVVLLRDEQTGWVQEWHRCRDWETFPEGKAARCQHINGDGSQCGLVVALGYGDLQNHEQTSVYQQPVT